jgi:HD-GYP domain-containing protein (c-di-GMP phosphodiesterase class II)
MTMLFANDVATDGRCPSWDKQIKSLSLILREEFGVPFRFYQASTGTLLEGRLPEGGLPLPAPAFAPPPELEGPAAVRLVAEGIPRVHPLAGGRYLLVLPFPAPDRSTAIAVGVISGLARTPADVLQEQARLSKWLQAVHHRLSLASQSAASHRPRPGSSPEGGRLVGLEALMGLEQLLRTQRVDKEPDRNRRQVLQTAATVLRARTLLWVPSDGDEAMIEGEPVLSCWDSGQLARMFVEDRDSARAGYLINNQVQATTWGGRFPQVATLLAMPVPVRSATSWLIALNKSGNPGSSAPPGSSHDSSTASLSAAASFRRSDAAALLPFAALLGVHIRAWRRHQQFKELLVGLTRSLAAAVDARDTFVAGHSERVARIAVELARELGLEEDELSDVYLSGLLHDVGKIGISDSLLRKRDPLTPEELSQLRQHVTIGSHFLSELHPIAHLLPAVLHHHERYDGTGYPDGLKGDTIPFLARILAVAESYDAMTALLPEPARPAREEVEAILSRGADVQWDGRVIAAFFRCYDRILAAQQRGLGESLRAIVDPATLRETIAEPAFLNMGRRVG